MIDLIMKTSKFLIYATKIVHIICRVIGV